RTYILARDKGIALALFAKSDQKGLTIGVGTLQVEHKVYLSAPAPAGKSVGTAAMVTRRTTIAAHKPEFPRHDAAACRRHFKQAGFNEVNIFGLRRVYPYPIAVGVG